MPLVLICVTISVVIARVVLKQKTNAERKEKEVENGRNDYSWAIFFSHVYYCKTVYR